MDAGTPPTQAAGVYQVEKIIGKGIRRGSPVYKCRWFGYGPEDDTIEDPESLRSEFGAGHLIEAFEADHKADHEADHAASSGKAEQVMAAQRHAKEFLRQKRAIAEAQLSINAPTPCFHLSPGMGVAVPHDESVCLQNNPSFSGRYHDVIATRTLPDRDAVVFVGYPHRAIDATRCDLPVRNVRRQPAQHGHVQLICACMH